MKKIAIIITGDVRNCKAKDIIIKQFNEFDVYCGSYIKHNNYINKIGKQNKSILLDPQNDIRNPFGINDENMQQNMLQWLHLDNIIKKYKEELLKYDILFKFRFDCIIKNCNNYYELINKLDIKDNILYNDSDRVFYSKSDCFIKTFEDFYDNIIKTYNYNGNNVENCFKKSWKSEPHFAYNLKEKKIINQRLISFNVTIDRGNYNKIRADGNCHLYDNSGKLLGKFS